MRPILLGFAALALFLGSLMMAPLTSEVAGSSCVMGQMADSCAQTFLGSPGW